VTENKHLLSEGNVLMVVGRVQEREDRPAEIMADKFIAVSKQDLTNPPKKQVKAGLYLRVPSLTSPEMAEVKEKLPLFAGSTPVFVVEASGKRLLAPESLWITPENDLISVLGEILGKENVKLVE
jgi:hypothetical protein